MGSNGIDGKDGIGTNNTETLNDGNSPTISMNGMLSNSGNTKGVKGD